MKKPKPFRLPDSFLNQLSEFSNGYYLVVVNDEMNVEAHYDFPNTVTALGLIQHLEIDTAKLQSELINSGMELGYDDEDLDDGPED